MKQINICLIGFGNVGRAFVDLIKKKQGELRFGYDLEIKITAVVTKNHGRAIDFNGLDLDDLLETYFSKASLDTISAIKAPTDVKKFISKSHAHFLLENSPVNYETGEPAITHIRSALECGIHAVSANKGPVAHAYQELSNLARENNCQFLFESAVMDGAPIFSIFRNTLPASNVFGFEGILNSCTNLIIEKMEEGQSFEEAIEYAQSIGIAETDPSGDIDGWDAAIKVAALSTVLMDFPLTPQQITKEGIRDLSQTEVQQAIKDGSRYKLVCRAERKKEKVLTSIRPEIVTSQSPLFAVNGTSSFILFKTDILPGLGILESNPGPGTTAYGLLADILDILKK